MALENKKVGMRDVNLWRRARVLEVEERRKKARREGKKGGWRSWILEKREKHLNDLVEFFLKGLS